RQKKAGNECCGIDRKGRGSLAGLTVLGNSLLTLYRILPLGSGAGIPPGRSPCPTSQPGGELNSAASSRGSSVEGEGKGRGEMARMSTESSRAPSKIWPHRVHWAEQGIPG